MPLSECQKRAKAAWIERNREFHLACQNMYATKYYLQHKEERRAYAREYYLKKKERLAQLKNAAKPESEPEPEIKPESEFLTNKN